MSYNSTHTGAQIDAAIDAVENKQDKLISGTNIQSFNGYSILTGGNFSPRQFGFTYCTCDTGTSTSAKVLVGASPSGQTIPGEGAIIVVRFTYDTGGNFTVEYSGRAPYSVLYKGAAIPAGLIHGGDEAVFMLCRSSDSSINYYFNLLAVTRSAVEGAGSLTEGEIRNICIDGYSITFASTITRSYSFEIGYTNGTVETKPVRDFAGQTVTGVDYISLNIGGISFDKSYTYLYQSLSAGSSPDRSKATEYTYTSGTAWQNGYIFPLSNMTITSIAAD